MAREMTTPVAVHSFVRSIAERLRHGLDDVSPCFAWAYSIGLLVKMRWLYGGTSVRRRGKKHRLVVEVESLA